MADKPICSIEGCGKQQWARGYCPAHYRRLRIHGDPLGGSTPHGEPLWFLVNVVFQYSGEGCLIWPYAKNSFGYGQLTVDGKRVSATRLACQSYNGPPPSPDHDAAHNCGNGHTGCCAPQHLRWATRSENMMDCVSHGTHRRGSRNSASKLTEQDVLKIRSLCSKLPQKEIALLFNIDPSLVSQIKSRKRWTWLD